MLDELRKIYSEIHVKLLILLILIITIAVTIAPIRSFSADDSSTKGRDAILILKDQYQNSKGELTTDKINETLKYYQSISSPDLAYVNSGIKYPGTTELLFDAYSPVNSDESIDLYKLKNADDFYNRNIVQIKSILEQSPNKYEQWEKDVILKKAESVEKPFKLDFNRQWVFAYRSLTIVFIMIAIAAIMIGGRLFSYEKENNMDIILSTISKSKLRKIGRNKVFALLTFLSIQFFISIIIFSIIFFSQTGINSWSSQIQIEYFTSIYNMTFGGTYLLFIFIGWLCIITIGVLVSLINAFLQKSYTSLVIGVIVVFLPIIITKLESIPFFIKRFFEIQPFNGFMIEKCILSLQIHGFIFANFLTTVAIIINSLVILGLCFLIVPRLFSFRINKI